MRKFVMLAGVTEPPSPISVLVADSTIWKATLADVFTLLELNDQELDILASWDIGMHCIIPHVEDDDKEVRYFVQRVE